MAVRHRVDPGFAKGYGLQVQRTVLLPARGNLSEGIKVRDGPQHVLLMLRVSVLEFLLRFDSGIYGSRPFSESGA